MIFKRKVYAKLIEWKTLAAGTSAVLLEGAKMCIRDSFDRDGQQRIHFSSAMTMLGKKDGANATDGSSYLEIVSFLKANGAKPRDDVQELSLIHI